MLEIRPTGEVHKGTAVRRLVASVRVDQALFAGDDRTDLDAFAALRAMAARVPEPGTNTLIVTHKPNILDAFGKDWFDIREGEASVFKPDGSGAYTLVGRVQIAQWATLK